MGGCWLGGIRFWVECLGWKGIGSGFANKKFFLGNNGPGLSL